MRSYDRTKRAGRAEPWRVPGGGRSGAVPRTAGVRHAGLHLEGSTGRVPARKRVVQSQWSVLPIHERMPDGLDAAREYEASGFEVTGMVPDARDRATMRVVALDGVKSRGRRRGSTADPAVPTRRVVHNFGG